VDFLRALETLATRGFFVKYTSQGTEYGYIPPEKEHQYVRSFASKRTLPALTPFHLERMVQRSAIPQWTPNPLPSMEVFPLGMEVFLLLVCMVVRPILPIPAWADRQVERRISATRPVRQKIALKSTWGALTIHSMHLLSGDTWRRTL